MKKILKKFFFELDGNYSKAKFVSVIAYVFTWWCWKNIPRWVSWWNYLWKRGENGFGYDPIFYLPELDKTFAEITSEEKKLNQSFESESLKKFSNYLREQDNED